MTNRNKELSVYFAALSASKYMLLTTFRCDAEPVASRWLTLLPRLTGLPSRVTSHRHRGSLRIRPIRVTAPGWRSSRQEEPFVTWTEPRATACYTNDNRRIAHPANVVTKRKVADRSSGEVARK